MLHFANSTPSMVVIPRRSVASYAALQAIRFGVVEPKRRVAGIGKHPLKQIIRNDLVLSDERCRDAASRVNLKKRSADWRSDPWLTSAESHRNVPAFFLRKSFSVPRLFSAFPQGFPLILLDFSVNE